MKPESLTISDGVVIVNILRRKAADRRAEATRSIGSGGAGRADCAAANVRRPPRPSPLPRVLPQPHQTPERSEVILTVSWGSDAHSAGWPITRLYAATGYNGNPLLQF
jgi:hypothetical protein